MKRSENGLIIYGVDKDEIALAVGERLEIEPSEKMIVKKYDGPTDYPRYQYSIEEWMEMPYFPKGRHIEKKDASYYKTHIYPRLRELIIDLKPKYYVELHSTYIPSNQLPNDVELWLEVEPHPANRKLFSLLQDYPQFEKSFIEEYDFPIIGSNVGRVDDVGYCPAYHGMTVEICTEKQDCIPEYHLRLGEVLMRILHEFLKNNY